MTHEIKTPLPEQYTEILNTQEYENLLRTVDAQMAPNHHIGYVPYGPTQKLEGLQSIEYIDDADLQERLRTADVIVCLARDEDPNPAPTDEHPEENMLLTPSGASNVDKALELYWTAKSLSNDSVRILMSGRMHNRGVRAMLALPIIGEVAGVDMDAVAHLPEARLAELLREGLTPEALQWVEDDMNQDDIVAHYNAFQDIIQDAKRQDKDPVEGILEELKLYPKMSTSRIMVKAAQEEAKKAGKELSGVYEEDGAFDTISNILYTLSTLEALEEDEGVSTQNIVVVASSDHAPRVAAILDHIVPDNITITVAESDPRLTPEAYTISCSRELGSFIKGRAWIQDSRDPDVLTSRVEEGYFGNNRKTPQELAAEIAIAGQTHLKKA